MSVSIKVAVRCRPFTIDDDLGVNLAQCGEEEGEVSSLLSNEVKDIQDSRSGYLQINLTYG